MEMIMKYIDQYKGINCEDYISFYITKDSKDFPRSYYFKRTAFDLNVNVVSRMFKYIVMEHIRSIKNVEFIHNNGDITITSWSHFTGIYNCSPVAIDKITICEDLIRKLYRYRSHKDMYFYEMSSLEFFNYMYHYDF